MQRVAVFYSISSTQKGLSGIDLGNFLIKQARPSCMRMLLAGPLLPCGSLWQMWLQYNPLMWSCALQQVAQVLLVEFPGLETLVTLSPIPGFRLWLESQMQREARRHSSKVTPRHVTRTAGPKRCTRCNGDV